MLDRLLRQILTILLTWLLNWIVLTNRLLFWANNSSVRVAVLTRLTVFSVTYLVLVVDWPVVSWPGELLLLVWLRGSDL